MGIEDLPDRGGAGKLDFVLFLTGKLFYRTGGEEPHCLRGTWVVTLCLWWRLNRATVAWLIGLSRAIDLGPGLVLLWWSWSILNWVIWACRPRILLTLGGILRWSRRVSC